MRVALIGRGERDAVPLSEAFSGRSNSFGFLRWVLATSVIVGHSYPLGGFGGATDPLYDWTGTQESFGGLAVAGFFIISGFLITRSWKSNPRVGRFIWHRFLRIFPAFWICLLVTAFLFAPFAWNREHGNLTGFLTEADPFSYVIHNAWLVMNQYEIGGLLGGTPYGTVGGGVWNGSLWTLSYEFSCYLVVAVLGTVGLITRHRAFVAALTGLAYLVMVVGYADPAFVARVVPLFADIWIGRFLFLFLLGALFALFADRIEINNRLALLAFVVCVATMWGGGWIALGYPALAYLLVWLAVRLPLASFDRPGDFSYGTYIYAFPIQMLLAEVGVQRFGLPVYMLTAIGVTTIAAVLSWHLVEKHALRLKRWTPRLPRRRAPQEEKEEQPLPPAAAPATAPAEPLAATNGHVPVMAERGPGDDPGE
jgi:peptidoglycan/LPS O-acetylase OafA/YrhL